jgi:hypothetical protein
MYAQHMSEIPFLWLSAEHTFKISANIGFWHRGAWAKQYDSLFCVLNEKGQVVTWQLTKGTSFEKVRSRLNDVKMRSKTPINAFYVDNCCMWRKKLEDVFGERLDVKLDLFHAVQRVIKKIPKRDKRGRTLKLVRQRMINDLRMVFRNPSDIGPNRMSNTPSPAAMLENIDKFLKKWKHQKYEEEPVLPGQAIEELRKLKIHVENGCLSDIPPSGGTNRNEALHKILRKNISRQRIGVQLALALLGISFYIWNEKRSNPDSKTAKVNRSIQSYYSSFFFHFYYTYN